MNLFDSAFQNFHDAGASVMGESVTVNGSEVTAIVTPLDHQNTRLPGVHVIDNSASLFIDPSVFELLGSNAVQGKIAVVRGNRMRVAAIQDGGATGVELICEKVEQRASISR